MSPEKSKTERRLTAIIFRADEQHFHLTRQHALQHAAAALRR